MQKAFKCHDSCTSFCILPHVMQNNCLTTCIGMKTTSFVETCNILCSCLIQYEFVTFMCIFHIFAAYICTTTMLMGILTVQQCIARGDLFRSQHRRENAHWYRGFSIMKSHTTEIPCNTLWFWDNTVTE